MPIRTAYTANIDHLQILDENAVLDEKLAKWPDGSPVLKDSDVVELFQYMTKCRALDEIAFKLQRSGRMGTYPQNKGQEAAAIGSAFALERLWVRRDAAGRTVAALAVVAVGWTADLGSGAIHALPDTDLVWIDHLREHPGGAVLMLPPARGRSVEQFLGTAAAMLQALEHDHPLANGYSGFFPPGQADQRERWLRFPDPDVVDELRADGVRWVVAELGWWDSDRYAAATAAGLEVVLSGPDGVLIDLGS